MIRLYVLGASFAYLVFVFSLGRKIALHVTSDIQGPPLPAPSSSENTDTVAQRRLPYFDDQYFQEEVLERPEGWETYTRGDMYDYFDCWSYRKKPDKRLFSPKMYGYLEKKYHELLREEGESPAPEMMAHNRKKDFEFLMPMYAKISPGKGRGVFASRDIKKGEKVVPRSQTVIFRDGIQYRKYIFSLDRRYVCDMQEWTWIQVIDKPKNFRLCTSFSDIILMNSDSEDFNIVREKDTDPVFYAAKDIKEGEELLESYAHFDTPWRKFGLRRENEDLGDDDETGDDAGDEDNNEKGQESYV